MVSEPTLAVSRAGVVAVVRVWCAWRVGPVWSRHGTYAGTGCTDVAGGEVLAVKLALDEDVKSFEGGCIVRPMGLEWPCGIGLWQVWRV